MARASNPPCIESVWHGDIHRHLHCGKRGKVNRGGNWYCGVHDPERLAAAQAVRDERKRLEREARDAARAKAEQRRRDIERVVRGVAGTEDPPVCGLCPDEVAPGQHAPGCIVLVARQVAAEWDSDAEYESRAERLKAAFPGTYIQEGPLVAFDMAAIREQLP